MTRPPTHYAHSVHPHISQALIDHANKALAAKLTQLPHSVLPNQEERERPPHQHLSLGFSRQHCSCVSSGGQMRNMRRFVPWSRHMGA